MANFIIVDASNFSEADDGNTTHYGGSIQVGNSEIQCYGTDRDCYVKWKDEVLEAIDTELSTNYSDNEDDAYALFSEVMGGNRVKVSTGINGEFLCEQLPPAQFDQWDDVFVKVREQFGEQLEQRLSSMVDAGQIYQVNTVLSHLNITNK